jgi:ferredoxin
LPAYVASARQSASQSAPLVDIALLPYPARDAMPMHLYNEPVARGKNVVLVSSRGCKLRCNYCTIPTFMPRPNYRIRPADAVVEEMVYCANKYQCDELYFDDDNMSCDPDHMRTVCEAILSRGLRLRWGCMGDAYIRTDLLPLMARAGCRLFKFGVEHFDRQVSRRIPKIVTWERAHGVVKACRENRIRSHATFMVGLPGSSAVSDRAMIEKALALRPTTIQFSVAMPIPGTSFYATAKEKGWLATEDWSKFDGAGRSVVSYPHYHWCEITAMHAEAWQRWQKHFLVYQPATVMHHLSGSIRRSGIARTCVIAAKALFDIIVQTFPASRIAKGFRVARAGRMVTATINGQVHKAYRGERALDVLMRALPSLAHWCGGRGRCATCVIIAKEADESLSPPTDRERDLLTDDELRAGYRLACQAKVRGDMRLRTVAAKQATA